MPQYVYKCSACYETYAITCSIDTYETMYQGANRYCGRCGHKMGRSYDPPPFRMPIREHYNATVGRYVNGERDFREGLKLASAQATERTGIEHNFKPVDLRDPALGITHEGLEDTNRTRHAAGMAPVQVPDE